MNKKIVYAGIATITITASASAFFIFQSYTQSKKTEKLTTSCPFEIKQCPDGSAVSRVGVTCDFALCKDDIKKEVVIVPQTESTSTISTTTKEESPTPSTPPKQILPPTIPKKTAPVSQANRATTTPPKQSSVTLVSTLISNAASTASNIVSSIIATISPQTSNFTEEKYAVTNGNIVSGNGTILYTLPQQVTQTITDTSTTTESHTVNVIPVGDVAPILNAIPITGLPGKYYLSENSFGNPEDCIFSNKIFILDTKTNEVTLMYEENNNTLSRDDPRACNSEIFLLATEEEKLILKYHTIGTNSLCDSAWSEPEKTWYLDVTKLALGMKKYIIPETLYTAAEQQESTCRETVEQ